MKKMIASALLLTVMSASMYAKEVKSMPAISATREQEDKTKIDPATLPEAVKTTLAGDTYKGWQIVSAWSVKADPAYYAVELKKEDKTLNLNLDKDGKVK